MRWRVPRCSRVWHSVCCRALQSVRTDVSHALKSEGATGHTGDRLWLRRTLVCAQVAFSLLLLTGAMLFTRSLRNVQNLDPGFPTRHLITFKADLGDAGYSQARTQAFAEDVRSKLGALHDVDRAALANMAVLEGDDWGTGATVRARSYVLSKKLRF